MIILGSKSPRRQDLLRGLGVEFEVQTKETDESYPSTLAAEKVPEYIARLKTEAFADLSADDILITADTVVILDGKIFGKPHTEEEAVEMLRRLSGRKHQVITGVCIRRGEKVISFSDVTSVHFRCLSDMEIKYYVSKYEPYDKAGAYGIQEWIGYIGVDWIEGSYFNVMGLPTHRVEQGLKEIM